MNVIVRAIFSGSFLSHMAIDLHNVGLIKLHGKLISPTEVADWRE